MADADHAPAEPGIAIGFEALSPVIAQGIGQAAVLAKQLAESSTSYDEAVRQRDAVIAGINALSAPVLRERQDTVQESQERIRTHGNSLIAKVRKGHIKGEISDEEVVFVHALTRSSRIGQYVFDLENAKKEAARFGMMDEGTPILQFTAHERADGSLADISLGMGGVLKTKPTLSSIGNLGPRLEPNVWYTFADGYNFTERWGRRMAIGEAEIATVVTAWLQTNQLGANDRMYMYQTRNILYQLDRLVPLGLTVPGLKKLQTAAVAQFRRELKASPSVVSSPEFLETLPSICVLDKALYEKSLTAIVAYGKFDEWEELQRAIAEAETPHFEDLPKNEADLAISRAGIKVAELRLAHAQRLVDAAHKSKA